MRNNYTDNDNQFDDEKERDTPVEEEDHEEVVKDKKRSVDIDPSVYCLTFVCLIEKVRKHKKGAKDLDEEERKKVPDWIQKDELADYFYKCTMVFCVQIMLVGFIIHAALAGQDSLSFTQPTMS